MLASEVATLSDLKTQWSGSILKSPSSRVTARPRRSARHSTSRHRGQRTKPRYLDSGSRWLVNRTPILALAACAVASAARMSARSRMRSENSAHVSAVLRNEVTTRCAHGALATMRAIRNVGSVSPHPCAWRGSQDLRKTRMTPRLIRTDVAARACETIHVERLRRQANL